MHLQTILRLFHRKLDNKKTIIIIVSRFCDFKNKIKDFGREINSKITYQSDGETIELGNEQLNSVTPHYESSILKSTMKQLDIDSNVDIPLETELNYQFGLKIENVPIGYTEVDYIEKTDNTSYIDTNLILGNKFKIEIDFSLSEYNASYEQPFISI